jgi:hypothetical protein
MKPRKKGGIGLQILCLSQSIPSWFLYFCSSTLDTSKPPGRAPALALRLGSSAGRYPVSCTTRMPCRSVIRALGQRATGCPVGRLCHFEVVYSGDALNECPRERRKHPR